MAGRATWWPTVRKSNIWKVTRAGYNCNLWKGFQSCSTTCTRLRHFPKDEVVSVQKRLLYTSGEDGSAKLIVSRISNLVPETVGGAYNLNTERLYTHSSKQPQGQSNHQHYRDYRNRNKQKSKNKNSGSPCSQEKSLLAILLQRLTLRR